MARTKRKINPLVQEVESSAPAEKIYKTAAYVRLSVEDSGKPGADTIEGQKLCSRPLLKANPIWSLSPCSVTTDKPARTSTVLSLRR